MPGEQWGHEVRELTEAERLGTPRRCSVEGCDEWATHEASHYYQGHTAGRPWQRRLAYCEVGAEEVARLHRAPIREAKR